MGSAYFQVGPSLNPDKLLAEQANELEGHGFVEFLDQIKRHYRFCFLTGTRILKLMVQILQYTTDYFWYDSSFYKSCIGIFQSFGYGSNSHEDILFNLSHMFKSESFSLRQGWPNSLCRLFRRPAGNPCWARLKNYEIEIH